MTHGHLADDRLIELCLGAQMTPADRDHLAVCSPCALRQLSFEQLLDETAAAATQEADHRFPADRLSRQQNRILQRIEQEGRPGRVIAFPGGAQEPAAVRHVRRSPRWIAAGAAAAGLAVGLLAGHLTDLPGATLTPERALSSSAGSLRPAVLSDDEFLGQLELAVGSATPAVLNPIDALTPGAADIGR